MKSARFDRLVASTALGLILMLAPAAGHAQQTDQERSNAAVAAPESTTPAPAAQDTGTGTPAVNNEAKTDTPNRAATIDIIDAPKDTATPAVAPMTEPRQDVAAPAAEPAPAPIASAPVATPSPTGDIAVADRLRELMNGRVDRFVSRKSDRDGAIAYYKANEFKPIWVTDGSVNARARAAIAFLAQVDTVGLDPANYPTPDFQAALTADALAESELKLTDAVLTYARHAKIGQIHFTRVAADISFKLDPADPADVLAKLAGDSDTAAALDSYNPPHAGFKALKKKLADIHAGKTAKADDEKPKPVHVPGGPILRPGMEDARVIALRERLDIADKDNPVYDDAVFEAVRAFQMESSIGVDGMLGPVTLRALNGTRVANRAPADPVDTILVNMERWRWLPHDLGKTHVIVNVPDYTLTLFNNDKVYWHTKIVAGRPANATPMLSADMKFITVNPTWNVPPSIIENEYLPALREDPMALERIGLKLEQAPDGTVRIYQPPGAANALGRIRFNFPNKFLVFQHDTPDKQLFNREKRAYSHGCMRVENPLTYGEKLLSLALPEENYTAAKLERMYGNNEININFPKPIPVHMVYNSAFVDQSGELQFREDVYGRDARMIAILKGSERRVADTAISRPPDTSARPVRMPVGMYGGGGYSRGPNLFEMLFGGPRYEVEPPRNQRPRGHIGPRATNDGRYYWR